MKHREFWIMMVAKHRFAESPFLSRILETKSVVAEMGTRPFHDIGNSANELQKQNYCFLRI